jgi:hypothetical protein
MRMMNWPDAVVLSVICLCITAMLIMLMVLSRPDR